MRVSINYTDSNRILGIQVGFLELFIHTDKIEDNYQDIIHFARLIDVDLLLSSGMKDLEEIKKNLETLLKIYSIGEYHVVLDIDRDTNKIGIIEFSVSDSSIDVGELISFFKNMLIETKS